MVKVISQQDRIAAAHAVQSYSPCRANIHRHLIHASLAPPESNTQTTSRSVQLFLHSLRQTVSLIGLPLSPQNCPFARGIWTPSNTCFLGLTPVHNPNGISIGSAIFVQLTSQCRQACRRTPFPSNLPLPLPIGRSGPHVIRGSWVHMTQHPKWHLHRVSHFCTAHRRVFLYYTMGCPSPSKLPLPIRGCGLQSNRWLLEST